LLERTRPNVTAETKNRTDEANFYKQSMDKKLHREKRAAYFQRQVKRYQSILKQFEADNLEAIQNTPRQNLTNGQVAAMLDFLCAESWESFGKNSLFTRTEARESDEKFHGTEADVTQTLTSEQRVFFDTEFPKARTVFALLLLPMLLDRLEQQRGERPPFNVAEYAAHPDHRLRVDPETIQFFGWAENIAQSDRQITTVLRFLKSSEAEEERKRYENHPARKELAMYKDLFWDMSTLGDSEDEIHLATSISAAAEKFTSAFSESVEIFQDSWISIALFSDDVKPQDSMPFLNAIEIERRYADIRSLKLAEISMPSELACLIAEAKIQYILNRPLAFAGISRAALEELLCYHDHDVVKDKGKKLFKRIEAMPDVGDKKILKRGAMKINDFGNNVLHNLRGFTLAEYDQEMKECMKNLDQLAERFLKK
jgi:hypothetical protein